MKNLKRNINFQSNSENLTPYRKCRKCGITRNIQEAPKCPVCLKHNPINNRILQKPMPKKLEITKELTKEIRTKMNATPLSVREQAILTFRFGLKDYTTHTLDETAEIYGVTKERIRQIQNIALNKIGVTITLSKT